MTIDVFTKLRQTKDGKAFQAYFGTLKKNNGDEVHVTIKFREGVEIPDEFPVTMVSDKKNMNLAHRVVEVNGNPNVFYTLWVRKVDQWIPYIDTSLEEFLDE